jgi:predicted SnoaL-like aldol condensation-catalyzing enzyme
MGGTPLRRHEKSDQKERSGVVARSLFANRLGDGIARLRDRIASVAKEGGQLYLTPRRFVAEGNFVLVLSEGDLPSGPTALYDLFRIENGKIVEHWDVLTPIPPRDQWKNENGPF